MLTGGFTRPFTSGTTFGISRAALPQAFAELNLLSPTLDPRITFTGGPISYVGSDGLLHTSAANEWPLEYDPVSLQPVGRSAWEARTNLLLQSATLATQSVTTTATTYTLSFTGTGTVTLSGSATGSKTGTGTGPANRVSLTVTATAGTLTLTVTGTVSNANLEAAAFAGPYIATTSAQVTRAAQVATVNDLTTLRFNPAASTVYAEFTRSGPEAANIDRRVVAFGNASGGVPSLDVVKRLQDTISIDERNVASLAITVNKVTFGPVQKVAARMAVGNYGLCLNAGTVTTSVNADVVAIARMFIGSTGTASYLCSPMSKLRLYPRALSNTELQALTA